MLTSSQTFTDRTIHVQLGTIGAEIGRACSWQLNSSYGNPDDCIIRATNYLNVLLSSKNLSYGKRREIARIKEVLNDWYYGDNLYQTTLADWDRYFIPFSIAANRLK